MVNKVPVNMGSGLTIKLMTLVLLGTTVAFAYQLNEKRKFPWHHGVTWQDVKDIAKGPAGARPS